VFGSKDGKKGKGRDFN